MPVAAKKKKPIDNYRRSLYGKIQVAIGQLDLSDDEYRDTLEWKFGQRSRTKLSNAQLVDLIEYFKTLGFKPKPKKAPARAGRAKLADGKVQKKARALWIALYQLGIVQEPSEKALGAFVKRQVNVDAINFMTPEQAYKVIEALKAWAVRDADVLWEPYASAEGLFEYPRGRVMEAQWRKLEDLGVVRIRSEAALTSWVCSFLKSPCVKSYIHFEDAEADRVIEALGTKIRKAQGASHA